MDQRRGHGTEKGKTTGLCKIGRNLSKSPPQILKGWRTGSGVSHSPSGALLRPPEAPSGGSSPPTLPPTIPKRQSALGGGKGVLLSGVSTLLGGQTPLPSPSEDSPSPPPPPSRRAPGHDAAAEGDPFEELVEAQRHKQRLEGAPLGQWLRPQATFFLRCSVPLGGPLASDPLGGGGRWRGSFSGFEASWFLGDHTRNNPSLPTPVPPGGGLTGRPLTL